MVFCLSGRAWWECSCSPYIYMYGEGVYVGECVCFEGLCVEETFCEMVDIGDWSGFADVEENLVVTSVDVDDYV